MNINTRKVITYFSLGVWTLFSIYILRDSIVRDDYRVKNVIEDNKKITYEVKNQNPWKGDTTTYKAFIYGTDGIDSVTTTDSLKRKKIIESIENRLQ